MLSSALGLVIVGIVGLSSVLLTGCGGSHSTSSSTPVSTLNGAAVITQINVGSGSNPGYTISIFPSGSATYTRLALSGTGQTGTGTVPAAVVSQFFHDLSAATPVQNLPAFTGTSSGLHTEETVQYQGETGPIDNPGDARESALYVDASAISQALGLPQYN